MGKVAVSRLKELRERKGLSQRRLAIALDKTENTIRNWEHGKTGIEIFEAVARLCEVLECSPRDLIGYIEVKEDAAS